MMIYVLIVNEYFYHLDLLRVKDILDLVFFGLLLFFWMKNVKVSFSFFLDLTYFLL